MSMGGSDAEAFQGLYDRVAGMDNLPIHGLLSLEGVDGQALHRWMQAEPVPPTVWCAEFSSNGRVAMVTRAILLESGDVSVFAGAQVSSGRDRDGAEQSSFADAKARARIEPITDDEDRRDRLARLSTIADAILNL